MEDTIGTMVLPSVKESTDTSGPVRYCSMTIRSPLLPNAPSSIMALTAACASDRVSAMMTPLPSASPSALITVGKDTVSR